MQGLRIKRTRKSLKVAFSTTGKAPRLVLEDQMFMFNVWPLPLKVPVYGDSAVPRFLYLSQAAQWVFWRRQSITM